MQWKGYSFLCYNLAYLCLRSMYFLISCDLYTFGDISHLFDAGV